MNEAKLLDFINESTLGITPIEYKSIRDIAEIIIAFGALSKSNLRARKIPMALTDKVSSNVNEPFFRAKL